MLKKKGKKIDNIRTIYRSVTVQNWIQDIQGNFFTLEKFPPCKDDQGNFSSAPIKRWPSGKWPLRGGWPLNRGKNNRKTLIGTLITGHLIEVAV